MARKSAKSIYKNILLKDIIIIVLKAKTLEELKNNPPKLKSEEEKNGRWFY